MEYIVHIDPDFFKRIMPEWSTYVGVNKEFAGTACHQESGYIQEIAQEVSMRERQHVWVDGSLSDGEWFKTIFEDIRKRFPHYRIAIFYISASEATIRARIAKRTAETGRSIPESQIMRSLLSPENSLKTLAPLTDIVARIWNENRIELKSVEDYSGNWYRGLGRLFTNIEIEELKFPHSLGTLYLEKTSLLGAPFHAILDRSRNDRRLTHVPPIKWTPGKSEKKMDPAILMQGYLDKDGRFRIGMSRRYFVLRPGTLSYYHDEYAEDLRGEFSLFGNFELLPNLETTTHSGSAPVAKRTPSSASSLLDVVVSGFKKDSMDTETGFYIRGFHTDGSTYSLALRASTGADKNEWLAAISTEVAKVRGGDHSAGPVEIDATKMGYKDTITLEIAKDALISSPNLRVFSHRLNPIHLEATRICPWTSCEKDTHTITGAPASTTNFRFLYPSPQVQSMMSKSFVTGVEDPDVLLLLFGGFAYLDANENIVGMSLNTCACICFLFLCFAHAMTGVMAISETPSQQCLTFSSPEPLPPADATRSDNN